MMQKKSTLLRLVEYIKPHWYLIVMSTVGGVIKLSLPLLLPQVLKYFTDELLVAENVMSTQQKLDEIIKWLIILVVVYLFVHIPATFLREAGATEVSNRVMHTMRCELYAYLQKMSAPFHHINKSGNLVTRINSDVDKVHEFVWNVATNIWIDSIMLVIYVVMLGRINIPLTIVAAVLLPLSVILTKAIRKQIRKASKKVQYYISELSGYFQERMAGFATVKLFNMEAHEKQKFNHFSEKVYRYGRRTNRFYSLGQAITCSMSEIINSLIVCLSAIYIVYDKMSIGDMIVFTSYLSLFITPLRRFAELNVSYARSIAGIERVFEIMDTPLDIPEKEDAKLLTGNEPMNVCFEHVSFRYDKESEHSNVSDIDFTIKEGEKVALVGSSGCGKTTLINLLTRFYDVDEGRITVAGVDIRDYQLDSLYRQLGMVFQDTVLFSETIEDNVRYGKPDATEEEMVAAAKAANAYDFIRQIPDGWNTLLGERGVGLSGGQKQRIAIARVFLRNPKLLILDEATSALDSESEELVQEALDNLMKGRTSIIIAHRLSTIVNVDRIIVMDKGQIVEMGSHEELLARNGRYAELYHMQFKDVLG